MIWESATNIIVQAVKSYRNSLDLNKIIFRGAIECYGVIERNNKQVKH